MYNISNYLEILLRPEFFYVSNRGCLHVSHQVTKTRDLLDSFHQKYV